MSRFTFSRLSVLSKSKGPKEEQFIFDSSSSKSNESHKFYFEEDESSENDKKDLKKEVSMCS